jgi:hypothetical protein
MTEQSDNSSRENKWKPDSQRSGWTDVDGSTDIREISAGSERLRTRLLEGCGLPGFVSDASGEPTVIVDAAA